MGGGGGAADSLLTGVVGEEVTRTREEWDREFFTSHVEYLSRVIVIGFGVNN